MAKKNFGGGTGPVCPPPLATPLAANANRILTYSFFGSWNNLAELGLEVSVYRCMMYEWCVPLTITAAKAHNTQTPQKLHTSANGRFM